MKRWVLDNRESFERDVLHDFCQASVSLAEQVTRFRQTGTVSFPVMRDLVGEPMNKGLLWRLKDKAHHLLRECGAPAGALLDWTLGYIFHESLKLMEDAHQQQYYVPRLSQFEETVSGICEVQDAVAKLVSIKGQTSESMHRETVRLEHLLHVASQLFCLHFTNRADHRPLARLLYDKEPLVRQSFGEQFPSLLQAIYAGEPERMYVEAAHSLQESARTVEAQQAFAAARAINPNVKLQPL